MKSKRHCAFWCGRGCTEAEYRRALKRSHALARALGPKWHGVVWENLGWHAKAVSACGRIKVHAASPGYVAFLGEPENPWGRWAEHGRNPTAAVAAVIRMAKRDLAALGAVLKGL